MAAREERPSTYQSRLAAAILSVWGATLPPPAR